jgi:serine-type D-Ala-D-Ala carboxypeptidase/endopeptidase (penicillin-binding protein 4)
MFPRKVYPKIHSIYKVVLLVFLLNNFTYQTYSQEDQGRKRKVTPTAPSTPSPTPSTITPQQSNPSNIITADELRYRIQSLLYRSQLSTAQVGIKVVSLDTNRILYEENAHKLMVPASNMKNFTVAAALDRLSPDYRFITSIYTPTRPDDKGLIRGDLIVYGRGDPTIAASFNSGNYFKAIEDLASRITATGLKRIEGDLIGDESYFTGSPYGMGWEWDDLQWYYGAEVSALSINDNSIDLTIKPGATVGSPCFVTIGPSSSLIRIENEAITAERGARRELIVHRPLGENVIQISGKLPLGDPGYVGMVAISKPVMMFVSMLRTALESKGIT